MCLANVPSFAEQQPQAVYTSVYNQCMLNCNATPSSRADARALTGVHPSGRGCFLSSTTDSGAGMRHDALDVAISFFKRSASLIGSCRLDCKDR